MRGRGRGQVPFSPRAETQGPQQRGSGCERPSSRAAGGAVGEARPARGRGREGSQTRPLPGRARPRAGTRSPFRDLPSLSGNGSEPKVRAAGRAGLRAAAEPLPFPRRWGSLHVAPPPGRAGRNERGRCIPTRVSKDSGALLFLKAPLQGQRGGEKAFVRKKGFLCFHGSFQKPLFLLPVASSSALQVPPNLLLPRVQSSELARLEEQAGASQANPAPGPQLRGSFTALAESPYS